MYYIIILYQIIYYLIILCVVLFYIVYLLSLFFLICPPAQGQQVQISWTLTLLQLLYTVPAKINNKLNLISCRAVLYFSIFVHLLSVICESNFYDFFPKLLQALQLSV